ncbi:MAG: GntP family permease [Gemmatales bacterium]|nr:GntP family permease [Gemmatales bacterium]MDW8385867.1 SLC13 family permease [Gemmatales bacterium]
MPEFDPYPLVLLVLGIATIFTLIIYLRINAFLALITAALLVGLLSPRVVLQTAEMDAYEKLAKPINDGLNSRNLTEAAAKVEKLADEAVAHSRGDRPSQPPRLALLNAPKMVAYAFGDLMGKIGLVIAFASIVGKALMESGAADRIVRFFVRLFGPRAGGLALLASGFVLSIPVFFDTVFLLLVPLAKALRLRTGKDYLLYVTAIGAGGAITHSLVPPTPGPIGMAEILNVDLGLVIVVGILVGAPLSLIGYAYAAWANRRWPTPLRQVGSVSLEELERTANRPDHELPSLAASLTPILLPVVLITAATVNAALAKVLTDGEPMVEVFGARMGISSVLEFLGNPNMALLLSAGVAMLLVARQKRMNRHQLAVFTAAALEEAGMILLITSAGGSFGFMLRAVGMGESLQALTPSEGGGLVILALAWGIAVLFKIAQGSGTVSMITTAGIIMPIVTAGMERTGLGMAEYLGYHPVYLVMAIGCGSKVGSWMNDSGFWVVCKMGGLTEEETLKSWTVTLVVMGISGIVLLLALVHVLPLT